MSNARNARKHSPHPTGESVPYHVMNSAAATRNPTTSSSTFPNCPSIREWISRRDFSTQAMAKSFEQQGNIDLAISRYLEILEKHLGFQNVVER